MAAPAALTRSAATEAHLLQKANHDQQQLKTFSRWWASELPEGIGLDNLVDGLKSGVAGITLIERLTGKPIDKRWHSEPGGNRVKMMENQSIFLARLKELGVHLVNISAEDIVDGRQTIVLGLTWKLITHFSEGLISDAGASDLHEWLKRNIQSQGVELTSWSDSSMKNGMALCALIHAYDPTALKLASVQPSNALENVELALTVAHERFGAPRLVDAADVVGDEDIKSPSNLLPQAEAGAASPCGGHTGCSGGGADFPGGGHGQHRGMEREAGRQYECAGSSGGSKEVGCCGDSGSAARRDRVHGRGCMRSLRRTSVAKRSRRFSR